MSALFYNIHPQGVSVATDTLALDESARTPSQFTEKAYAVPHMQCIVTGTGIMEVVDRYYANLIDGVVADDVDELNDVAPALLQSIHTDLNPPERATTTVYHFGVSESEGRYVGYGLHSGRDFRPRRLEEPRAFKPADHGAAEGVDGDADLEELATQIIKNLKDIDDERPDGERMGIGGEVQLRMMGGFPPDTVIKTIHRFDDYDRLNRQIHERANG